MADLTKTIEARSDILNADDLMGRNITIKITNVSQVAGDQPIAINYDGDNGKPFMPCKSMRRVLVHAWGADGKKYVGKSLTLYRDDKVKFGGMEVGGVRISHMSDIPSSITMALTATRANKKPFTVKPLQAADSGPHPSLVEAGNAAADGGAVVYKEWLDSLSPDNKASIKHLHSGWSKAAKAADAAVPEEGIV